ncbi:hypothetical protein [Rhizobium leguminosarum]|uniref:hypothetical protein n=1 Tax=Rhizobium leguminosarum TaxID=384 RepID=UPI001C97F9E8|nr:hypothetical protein [Rhizobium leguminosarum]MBY5416921.1 hypothetical protein [Rhizobium leguminosarum]
MPLLLKLNVTDARPLRRGSDWFWSVLMEKTANGKTATASDIDGAGEPYQEMAVKLFLKRMVKAGFVSRSEKPPYQYAILKRQPNYPLVTEDGGLSKKGLGQQYMWNVMRRSPRGFTIAEVAANASTDDVAVSAISARMYINQLHRAGILKLLTKVGEGQPGRNAYVYVLPGSQNSGPKAPRIHKASLIYDPNVGTIKGDVVAEEDRT